MISQFGRERGQYGYRPHDRHDETLKTTPKVGELRELIVMLKQQMPARGPRRLAMVTSKPITFVVARVFEHLVRSRGLPLEVKVFMTLGRAWAWLRPDAPPFQLR